MTIRRCDFSGEVIPDQTGNSVTLADIERMEAKLDGCDACIQLLRCIVEGKCLRRLYPNSPTTVRLTETKTPERSRFHEWKYDTEGWIVCMNCGVVRRAQKSNAEECPGRPGAGAVPPEVTPI